MFDTRARKHKQISSDGTEHISNRAQNESYELANQPPSQKHTSFKKHPPTRTLTAQKMRSTAHVTGARSEIIIPTNNPRSGKSAGELCEVRARLCLQGGGGGGGGVNGGIGGGAGCGGGGGGGDPKKRTIVPSCPTEIGKSSATRSSPRSALPVASCCNSQVSNNCCVLSLDESGIGMLYASRVQHHIAFVSARRINRNELGGHHRPEESKKDSVLRVIVSHFANKLLYQCTRT